MGPFPVGPEPHLSSTAKRSEWFLGNSAAGIDEAPQLGFEAGSHKPLQAVVKSDGGERCS
jgi:hypothetical protein